MVYMSSIVVFFRYLYFSILDYWEMEKVFFGKFNQFDKIEKEMLLLYVF